MPVLRLRRIALLLVAALVLPFALIFLGIWVYVTQPIVIANRPSPARVDTTRLRKHVVALSQEFHPRNHMMTTNLEQCAGYIRNHFELAGARTSVQEFTVERGTPYKNICGMFGPSTGKRVVVGAHYDTCRNTPGANDNASGVAGLIELAYLLGMETNLQDQVELVAYCLEEPPYFGSPDMGSAHHARAMRKQGVDVRVMISLEMIGCFSDEENSQQLPSPILCLFYPGTANFIGIVGRAQDRSILRRLKGLMAGSTDLPVYSVIAPPDFGGIDLSDHRNYWAQGYNAVMVTDTAFYRNTTYHGPGDTADRLDYERMGKTVIEVFAAVKGIGKK